MTGCRTWSMEMRNYAALERGADVAADSDKLTPELLGTFIALAWQEAKGIAPGSAAGADIFELVMSRSDQSFDDLPDAIQEILDYQGRPSGVKLEQLTNIKVGAQATGSIGRLNPQNIAHVYKSHPIEARFVLDKYSGRFPEVVAWVRKRARSVDTTTQVAIA